MPSQRVLPDVVRAVTAWAPGVSNSVIVPSAAIRPNSLLAEEPAMPNQAAPSGPVVICTGWPDGVKVPS